MGKEKKAKTAAKAEKKASAAAGGGLSAWRRPLLLGAAVLPLLAYCLGLLPASAPGGGAKEDKAGGQASAAVPTVKKEAAVTQDGPAWDTPDASTADGLASAARKAGINMSLSELELPGAEREPMLLSESPRIYLFEDLLSGAECDFLTGLVDGRLKPAGVVLQTKDKHTVQMQARNNEQIWITPDEEKSIPVLKHVLKRMHRVAHIPDTDAEALQIGRYEGGQKYESHLDTDPAHDVERPATLLVYLSDVEEGGDTLFPRQRRSDCASRWHTDSSGEKKFGCQVCCEHGQEALPGTLRVRPRKGSALLFFNHKLDGAVEPLSEHAACPVQKGVKWIAQRWFRLDPYQNVRFPLDPRFDGIPTQDSAEPYSGRARELHRKAPRVFALENFVREAEADLLVRLAKAGGLGAAEPLPAGGESWRMSEELEHSHPEMAALAKRLHRAARVPEANGELIEVVRLGSDAELALKHHGQETRVAAVWAFLQAPEQGGEVVFPKGCSKLADCCGVSKAIKAPARKGRGVLWYLKTASNRMVDKRAVSGVCPVRRGEAWLLRYWFNQAPQRTKRHAADPAFDLLPQ